MCRGYGSREYGDGSYIKKKWRVDKRGLDNVLLDSSEIVNIANSIAINNKLSLLIFINIFSY